MVLHDKDVVTRYRKYYQELSAAYPTSKVMEMGVGAGGNFDALGILEKNLLIQHGLSSEDYLIDVGCGSGRLTKSLAGWSVGRYLGVDVVPEFVEHARQVSGRDDWRFEVTDGTSIPEKDGCSDFVVFFSVFTHVSHEQSYQYLVEAKRVLKPGGKIVFSFIEFQIPDHWIHFVNSLQNYYTENRPLNVFLSRDAIERFALHIDLQIDWIIDGDKPHIKIDQPIEFSNGTKVSVMAKLGPIGQSVCIMRKKNV